MAAVLALESRPRGSALLLAHCAAFDRLSEERPSARRRLSAHVGDVVRFVSVSGAPHNVSFWEDSIPAGAAATLQRNMQRTMGTLSGVLLTEPNETYTVSLAGLRPGTYRYYCLPHLALKMVGRITVRP